jgi:hypothetical protein
MVTGLVCEPREYTKSWSTNSLGLPISPISVPLETLTYTLSYNRHRIFVCV